VAVGFVWHDACLRHDNGPGHPERPERLRAIRAHLEKSGLLARLDVITPEPCPIERLERVHSKHYVKAIREACAHAPMMLDPDTMVSAGSWDAALLSAGGALAACDAVMTGRIRSAFVCTRPPGHHAERDRAMGFCLFNNIAVAARYLQDEHGCRRVAILDWDVHHGNGTQHLFERDHTVLYASTHQFPFYPGTGAASKGTTINVPLQAGSGDTEIVRAFGDTILPAVERFAPDAILISAGFDAHRDDPLAGLEVTEAGYGVLTTLVRGVAERVCGGRIVSFLEGGYDLRALGASVEAHLEALKD
jgi:acetoin utilization deacetylase AcuC-like enzyme